MMPNDETKIEQLIRLVRERYPNLAYHNSSHGLFVWANAKNLGLHARLSYDDNLALETASLLHDFYVVPGQDGINEKRSSNFAMRYLPRLGFSKKVSQNAGRLILATTMPQRPSDELEKLICDADLSSLGSPDYLVWQNRLREEWNKLEDKSWYELQLRFLSGHKYHSQAAIDLFGKQKDENIKTIRQKLLEYDAIA